MKMLKSTLYSDLLQLVNLKSIEHRRYTQALRFFIIVSLMGNRITSGNYFLFVILNMTFEALVSLNN